ncbi:MAG: hypothetical protein OIN85_01010 [Candidatus Methanoperedens sp.]|nr:hypothetical protein [Candidatus Methanoperedens sp.]
MEYDQWKSLTPEQKKKAFQIYKGSTWFMLKYSFTAMCLLLAADVAVIEIYKRFVDSEDFLKFGFFVNALFYFISFFRTQRKERDRVREELKKI